MKINFIQKYVSNDWLMCHRLTLLFLALLLCHGAISQTIVRGKVTNTSGEPISGVSVTVKDTMIATATNDAGNYEISVPPGKSILVFSHVGAQRQEQDLLGRSTIDIILDGAGQNLDEVVVVGYGTQRRDVITTSISKLDNKVLDNIPYANIGNALQGNLAGVRVQSNSGQPGAAPNIIIRGGTSINNPNSSPPIYIIDGVLRSNMNDIGAHDIKSIQVLKDAAATAIYGAQGSNGVVIVETKSGESGKARVTYKVDLASSRVGKTFDILTGAEEVYFARLGLLATGSINPTYLSNLDGNVYLGGAGNDLSNTTTSSLQYLTPENQYKLDEGWESIPDPADPSRTLLFSTTDWQSMLFRNAFSHNHALSVSGGNEKSRFYLGLGYIDNQGIAIQTDYKRLSLNLNGELDLSDKVKLYARILYANKGDRQAPTVDVFKSSLIAPTTNKLYFEDGTLSPGRNFSYSNPFYRMSVYNPKNKVNDLTMIVGAEAEIVPNLTFSPQFSFQYRGAYSRNFLKSYLNGPTTLVTSRNASGSYSDASRPQFNAILTYGKTFNSDHDVEVKGGFSYLGANNISLSANGADAATDIIPTLNASATPTAVAGSETQHALIGYFSRATYNFKRKYMLNVSLRYDGASNLGENNKWGLFPGASLGWNLDKENFWSIFPEDLIRLKLRGSYGVTGNISGLGLYQAQGEYSASTRYDGDAGIQITTLPNQDLKWERSKTADVGFDLGLFNNRINIIFDYYRRVTDNLLTSLNLPPSTGFATILTNYGSLENKGYEIELNTHILKPTSAFQWNLAFNTATVNSKILRLPENGIEYNRVGGVYVYDPKKGDYAWLGGLQEGQRIGDLYAYKQVSVYATDEEAMQGPVDMLIPRTDKTKYGGDVNWLDVDRNDTIDTRDRVYMGNSIPRITGGLTNNFSYKNLSLSVRMDYTIGATIYNEAVARMEGNFSGANAISANMRRSWQNQGDITDVPRYYWADQNAQWNVWGGRGNSRHYEKLDFLCLREVTIGYGLSKSIVDRLGIADFRINLTGANLYYFTKYGGLSPEQTNSDAAYPNPRSFIFGASITF
ncbi:SusC/RagA family TonB-linked outer membrane protein [Parapedobacter indicus]|uniref:TonB-linked outer membrane protein, SusC/RagA family n=1 Tax=Parapedobacter indicus TaxID=1477437 RepID=A0A1I3GUT5_9SPHI|nr:TonB-dependent receptor [Parapedobacter indicus]PPL02787.1 TonB-linked SusC/RagA family outer membrane protein [Parapedobacter indicus]SFI27109.1 TonB-linked outer membrane protein, SusC/RagA family [Parapedobacter indicus]